MGIQETDAVGSQDAHTSLPGSLQCALFERASVFPGLTKAASANNCVPNATFSTLAEHLRHGRSRDHDHRQVDRVRD